MSKPMTNINPTDALPTWDIYESDDPVAPVATVRASTYEAAVRAALAEMGYFITQGGSHEGEDE
jgi:hypothetical protein